MPAMVEWIAHMPGVALADDGDAPVPRGRLSYLPFESWVALDDSFQWSDSKYNRSRPVFYIGLLDAAELGLDQVESAVRQEINSLHSALLLLPGGPIFPEPPLSTHYLRLNLGPEWPVRRYIGPVEREWIVFGSPVRYVLEKEHLALVAETDARLHAVRQSAALTRIVDPALQRLALVSRPEMCWGNEIVGAANVYLHCIAAAERVLLPAGGKVGDSTLTATFGRHAAVLMSESRTDLAERVEWCSDFYRLRSRLIHGEVALTNLPERDANRLQQARMFLGTILFQLTGVAGNIPAGRTLPSVLAEAFNVPAVHGRLFVSPEPTHE